VDVGQGKSLPYIWRRSSDQDMALRGLPLRLWARAFDEWLAERQRNYKAGTVKQSVLAWLAGVENQ